MVYGLSVAGATYDQDNVLDRELGGIIAAGAKWVRVDVDWSIAEAVRGRYNWWYADRIITRATVHGLQVLAVLSNTPEWARPTGTSSHGAPLDVQEFVRFTQEAVGRYAGRGVHTWEIWNEPNTSDFWEPTPDPVKYSVLLRLSAAAVHRVDPHALVLSGGLTPGSTTTKGSRIAPLAFVRALYDNSAMADVGAVAIHPYTFPENPAAPSTAFARLPLIRDLMVERGDRDKKVWLTEFGAPTGTAPGSVTEAGQAGILEEGYLRALRWDWVGGIFLYQLRDAGPDQADLEENFGLLRHDYSAKPAWFALRAATGRSTG
ncbi:MAG: polysaccharide biosynthesis protein PslG [Acidimicrobiia bacterium]|nr:polysaccharide biosynthesis protein PslG [Acidimicrobiia bacterium]